MNVWTLFNEKSHYVSLLIWQIMWINILHMLLSFCVLNHTFISNIVWICFYFEFVFVIVSVICNDRNHTVFTYTIEPNATYTVENNSAVTLVCPLPTTHDYPTWSGPMPGGKVMQIYNWERMSDFMRKQDRLSWARNNRDLVISPVIREDEGMYECSAALAGNWFSELLVRGNSGLDNYVFVFLSCNHFRKYFNWF